MTVDEWRLKAYNFVKEFNEVKEASQALTEEFKHNQDVVIDNEKIYVPVSLHPRAIIINNKFDTLYITFVQLETYYQRHKEDILKEVPNIAKINFSLIKTYLIQHLDMFHFQGYAKKLY